jgi:hypothetical protein
MLNEYRILEVKHLIATLSQCATLSTARDAFERLAPTPPLVESLKKHHDSLRCVIQSPYFLTSLY